MAFPIIIRRKGPNKRRWGIMLKYLKPHQIKILFDFPLLRDGVKESDQFVHILYNMLELERKFKISNENSKVYYNKYKDMLTDYNQIQKDYNSVDWKCAICLTEIESEMANFSVENFLCKTCNETHGGYNIKDSERVVDGRIVQSSIYFRKYCQKILKKEKRKFIHTINGNRSTI